MVKEEAAVSVITIFSSNGAVYGASIFSVWYLFRKENLGGGRLDSHGKLYFTKPP